MHISNVTKALASLVFVITLVDVCVAMSDSLKSRDRFPILKGPYLGQEFPGMKPEIFAPGIISKEGDEFGGFFSPDGKEFYYSTRDSTNKFVIMSSILKEHGWCKPSPVWFSGEYSDCAAGFSLDGEQFYFVSVRPVGIGERPFEKHNIWVIRRKGERWIDPQILPTPINSPEHDLGASFTKDGTIYFNTTRNDITGGCRAQFKEGQYSELERVGDLLSTSMPIIEIAVDPNAEFMIFTSWGQNDGFGGMDMYISFNEGNDSWTSPVNMGSDINTEADEHFATLSPDGEFIFFTSNRPAITYGSKQELRLGSVSGTEERSQDRTSDIYWIDTRIIEKYR